MGHEEEPSSGCAGLHRALERQKAIENSTSFPPGVGAQGYLELLVMFGAGLREMNSFQQRWKMSLYAGL